MWTVILIFSGLMCHLVAWAGFPNFAMWAFSAICMVYIATGIFSLSKEE